MLTYRCTNACRHCLYRCSPRQPDEWISMELAERVFHALRGEPALQSLHIAGGEPSLRMDLLVDVIQLGIQMGLPIQYVETNASWCGDRERCREGMERLRDAGLPGILISVSMFHNEFVPFRSTRICVEVALQVFGVSNVILYLPHMYRLLSQMPDDGTHKLEEFIRWADLEGRRSVVPDLYQVIPSGRAVDALRDCYESRPAETYEGETCREELLSTTHFHIDHHGDLFTGMCAGIAPAGIDGYHPEITPESHPVFWRLCHVGPWGLMKEACAEHGFRVRASGYVSRCDLCFDVRRSLHRTGQFPELRPAAFYSD